MAREMASDAMEVLRAAMSDEDPRVRVDAAKHVLDRAIGKPIAMSADVTDRLDEFTDEQLDAAIADVERRISAVAETARETAASPITH